MVVVTGAEVDSVIGQIVVETGIVFVVTWPTGQFVTVEAQLVIVSTEVVYIVLTVDPGGTDIIGVVKGAEVDSVTGQTVVEIAIVFVVTWPTGQFVTVEAQLVIVSTEVV